MKKGETQPVEFIRFCLRLAENRCCHLTILSGKLTLTLIMAAFTLLLGLTAVAEPRLLDVPLAPQTTNYSCGAASMQSLLAYYGHQYSEAELIRRLKTNPSFGTDHNDMVKFARQLGIDAEVKYNQSIEDIKREVATGNPVIVEFQAWPDKPLTRPYPEIWDQGHYAVVVGADHENLYFVDPVIFGGRGFIKISEFLERWHDLGKGNVKLYSTILYFRGKANPPPSLQAIP